MPVKNVGAKGSHTSAALSKTVIDHRCPRPFRRAVLVETIKCRRRHSSLFRLRQNVWLLGLLVVLAACQGAADAAVNPAPNAASAQDSFWTRAAAPYVGSTLYGISEDSPPSLYVRDVLAPHFAAETGIDVQLHISTIDKIEQIIENGGIGADGQRYDFVYVEQDVVYGYLAHSYLTNVSQLLSAQPALASPDFVLDDFTEFIHAFADPQSGDLYGLPIEAFIKAYLYRTDLFGDPALQKQFVDQYHYPLAPAVTLDQYRDIAEFFTRYGEQNGLALWGTSVQGTTSGVASFYEFFETIAPAFGLYHWGIDLNSYYATEQNGGSLDSQRAVDALTYWVNLLAYAPPESRESDWNDVAATFAAGRVAQGWVYGEHVAWMATDATRSHVVGKVGVALPPTAPGVMEDATIGAGYLGYYDSAAFGIPVDSQNKEAALLWLQYLAQPSIQADWAIKSGRVVHLSTFDDPLVRAQDRRLHGYYSVMKKQGSLFSVAPPFPFHTQVRDVIAPYIQAAIAGQLTPEAALKAAAQAADAELTRLGYIHN